MLLSICLSVSVQAALNCIVCDKTPLVGRYWKHPHGELCPDCYRIDTRCDVCQLPIKKDFIKTKDGRYICKFEKDDVVIDEELAKVIFKSAVSSVLYVSSQQMRLRGPYPDVRMFDIDYWNDNGSARMPGKMRRGGFSQTRSIGNRYTHNVILLSGLPKDELISVSAHEYTHLWINENRPESRNIETDTLEGICELVAYKVCERAGFTNQLSRIVKNPYTKGRILDALESSKRMGFADVLNWVKRGNGERLPYRGSAMTARSTPPPAPNRATPARPTPTNSTDSGIRLTSIARTSRGFRAEINGVQFYQGDLKRISIQGRLANLQCIEVTGRSVMFSINRERPLKLELSR
tara:strand:+ start:5260 stop:6309 length:1050 start_codon:yes stop_codon:yes gene_type:complete